MQVQLYYDVLFQGPEYKSCQPQPKNGHIVEAELLGLTSATCMQTLSTRAKINECYDVLFQRPDYKSCQPWPKNSHKEAELLGLTSATCVRILSTRASKADVLKVWCWASCCMSLVNSASLSFMNWPGRSTTQQSHLLLEMSHKCPYWLIVTSCDRRWTKSQFAHSELLILMKSAVNELQHQHHKWGEEWEGGSGGSLPMFTMVFHRKDWKNISDELSLMSPKWLNRLQNSTELKSKD